MGPEEVGDIQKRKIRLTELKLCNQIIMIVETYNSSFKNEDYNNISPWKIAHSLKY